MEKNLTREAVEALEYFHGAGMIENLKSTEQYYVQALMDYVAKKEFIELEIPE